MLCHVIYIVVVFVDVGSADVTYVNPEVSGTNAPNPKNGGMEMAKV